MLHLHLPGLFAAVVLIASAQAFFAWSFLRGASRGASGKGKLLRERDFPSARVFIPCAGVCEDLARAVEALLSQDYPGRVEFVFVTPSESDRAHAALSELLEGRPRARLLASNAAPKVCGGKIRNLLHGLACSPPDAQLLVFTDADLRVPPGWLRALTAPLSDPEVSAATSAMRYRAHGGLAARLRSAWMAAGVPYLAAFGVPCGQSLALRSADFKSLGVEALWSRSLLEDLALHGRLHGLGRVAFVHEAMPESEESADWPGVLAMTGRWILAFRVYVPWMWAMGALVTCVKLDVLFHALRPPVSWGLLSALLASDAAYLAALAAPGERLCAAVLSPLLTGIYGFAFARSLITNKVCWAAHRYLLRGPQDVEVLP